MSMTELSYWSYMAAVMANQLATVIKKQRIEEGDFPINVYGDAKRFFAFLMPAVHDRLAEEAEDPVISLALYVLAIDIVRSLREFPQDQEGIKALLTEFSSLLEALGNPHDLRGQECLVAQNLQKFFRHLEIYETRHFYIDFYNQTASYRCGIV